MKKLLIRALVLGVAALAPATLQISVDGNPDPVDSETVVLPSDTLTLGIHGTTAASETIHWLMVVDNALATLSGGVVVQGDFSYASTYTTWMQYYAGLAPPFTYIHSVGGWVGDISSLSGLLIGDIDFNALASGDAVVYLYSSPDSLDWAIADTLTVHIIPEPMTMSLLALGGLLISKRK